MQYLLGVDLGTSGCKTVLFDLQGRSIASATCSYPLSQPQNGWAEQDPEDWYQAALSSMRQVVEQSQVPPAEIMAAAISGQMHGLVMLDRGGAVIRPAILWCDARTQRQCEEITRTIGEDRLLELNGNPALTGFTAPKLLWVREHEPEHFARCATVLLPKDYVRYRLTGVLAMEISDASGTNLFDLRQRCWSSELVAGLGLNASLLPDLLESTALAGNLKREAADLTGLRAGMPIAAGAADNAAAALGTGVCQPGQAFVTLGTSGVIFAHTQKPVYDPAGRVHTFCGAVPGAYAVLSCTLACGQSLSWGRDLMYSQEKLECERTGENVYDLMTAQAATIAPGAEGLLYLPYLMGERSPLLDPQARGVFFGLSALHTRAHLTRAMLEGICFSQRHNLEVLQKMHVVPEALRACGGGARSRFFRQLLSDILHKPVRTVTASEGPALGAAILAACAAGIFRSVPEGCQALVAESGEQCDPEESTQAQYAELFSLYTRLYPRLKDSFAELAALREKLK